MSIVNSVGEQVSIVPKRSKVVAKKKPKTIDRDSFYLQLFDAKISIKDIAEVTKSRLGTVRSGIAAALKLREEAEAREQFKLTEDDLRYLLEAYPAGTEVGDNPEVRAYLDGHSHLLPVDEDLEADAA